MINQSHALQLGRDVNLIAKNENMFSDEFSAKSKANYALVRCFLFNLIQARP